MLYSNSEIFLDAISLLININDNKTKDVINELIEIANTNMQTLVVEHRLVKFFIKLIKEIIAKRITLDDANELTMLLLKFKSDPITSENEEIYNRLQSLFLSENKMSRDRLSFCKEKIQNYIIWNKCNSSVRRMFGYLNRCTDTVDPQEQRTYLDSVLSVSKDIQASFDISVDEQGNSIEKIDFNDVNSIAKAKTKYSERKVQNIMKMGLQGFNQMCGKRRGLALGESIVINGLAHGGKSLTLKLIAKWIVAYNIPPVHQDGKVPLLLFISLENEANEDMMWFFRNAYETTTNESCDGLSDDYVIQYIHNFFTEKGYHFIVERYLPSEFGYEEFKQLYEKYENSGYFIIASIIDYVNNMKKTSANSKASSAGNHLLVKELYSNMCNYTKSKGTLLATAHQLNRKADEIACSGLTNVVKRFSTAHLADSMDVQREVDMSVFIYIEKNQSSQPYFTFNCTKHRYVDDTPDAHKYFAVPFTEWGIMDDVNTQPTHVRDIYAVDTKKEKEIEDINKLFE
jgi:hypothetical protein